MRKRSLRDWWDEYYDTVPPKGEAPEPIACMAWVEEPGDSEDDYVFAEFIKKNYEAAMSRSSSYKCRDLAAHVMENVYFCPDPDEGSVLVGCYEAASEHGVFVASHFAPATRKGGVEMLQKAAESATPFVFCVPRNLARQLVRLGFIDTGVEIPQWFNGGYVQKNVVVNNACREEHLAALAERM